MYYKIILVCLLLSGCHAIPIVVHVIAAPVTVVGGR